MDLTLMRLRVSIHYNLVSITQTEKAQESTGLPRYKSNLAMPREVTVYEYLK